MSETIKNPRILLVDDKPENIDVLAELLREDYQILVALNDYRGNSRIGGG